jgi:hypothetical protein
MIRLPLLLALLVAIAGCAAPAVLDEPELPAAYPNHSLAQVLAAIEAVAERDSVVAFSSQARLALRSPQQNADVGAMLRARGDTLWASLRGPLNIEAARLLATADSFFLHDRLRNQLVAGPAEAVGQILPGPVVPDELRASLLGTITPPDGRYNLNPTTLDGVPGYWLTAPDGRTRIAVSALSWRVLRYERLGSEGGVLDRRRYADHAPVAGRLLPRTVELASPVAETSVTIEHRQITLNPETLAFPFDASGARRVAPQDAAPMLE